MSGIPRGQRPKWLQEEGERRERIFRTCIANNPFIPPEEKSDIDFRDPTDRQTLFLTNNFEEVLFGGAGGGGKSDGLLMAALMYIQMPHYDALLLRRTYPELAMAGAIMDRAHHWLSPWIQKKVVHWNASDKRFTFPSGATLSFGYLLSRGDELRYQSSEFNFIGFDELTHFPEYQYRYLWSRLRRGRFQNIPGRLYAATNPGGPGGEWVKARWGLHGILDYNIVHAVDQNGEMEKRLFIGARVEENPYIDQEDYIRKLGKLDTVTYLQLRMGDWDVIAEGFMFRLKWFEDAYVSVDALPPKRRRVRGWDLAATPVTDDNKTPDYTSGVLMSVDDDTGIFYIEDMVMVRMAPADRDEFMAEIAARDGPDVPIRVEQEGGASGKSWIDSASRSPLFMKYDFDGMTTGGKSKEVRAQPMATAAKQGRLKLVSNQDPENNWNGQFLNLLCPFPQEGLPDDPIDAASLCYNWLVNAPGSSLDLEELAGVSNEIFYS